jgi:hypothetical protein
LEQWYNLTLGPGPRPALILDVSESARSFWPVIRSLTEGVLETLPPASFPRLFFLGNPQPFDATEFAEQAERWFVANAGRGSFVGPIFEQLTEELDIAMAVVGAGRIFDLPDWHEAKLAQHAVWCRYGSNALTDGAFPEESYTVEQLAERLNNPLVRVEIGGPAAMPVFWDDPSFRWEKGKLAGAKASGSLRFGVLSPTPEQVAVSVVLANGIRRQLPLVQAEAPPLPDWRELPSREDNLIRQALRQGRYNCPACRREHAAGQWKCSDPTAAPVFPTFASLGQAGFCILDASAWQARIRPHPCSVLQLSLDAVAVRCDDGKAEIVRFNGSTWQPTGEFLSPIHSLQERRYALVL